MTEQPNTDRIESPTTRDFERPKSVTVTVVSGSVDVIASPHTRQATLEVHELTGPPLATSWTGGALKLEQLKDADGQVWGALKSFLGGAGESHNRPRVRLTLSVPDDTSVSVRTVSADVLSGGSHGPVTVYTVSGDVTLDHPTGRIDVTTVSGDVDCASPSGELKAKTVSGDITVRDAVLRSARVNSVSGRTILDLRHGPALVTANSVSGEVSVRMPADSGYDASVASTSGHVVVDGEPLLEDGKRGGHRYAGDRSVAVKARTVTGDLVVLRRAGDHTGPATGPVIGDTWGAPSDIQDDVPGQDRRGSGGPDAGTGI